MKLNISYPATGCQKLIEVADDHKLRIFYDKRMGMEVPADSIGDEWKGYVFRIAGGNDKQGFPMKQGVLSNVRVRLLLSKGHSCYRPRRTGERKRKSVRGCIVDSNLSVLACVVVRKGEQEIPGLTDNTVPRRLGPKRASKIRKLFNLQKEDDVRQYVIKRPLAPKPPKEGKKKVRKLYKAPKIQRLITPVTLQRKRHLLALKKRRCLKRKEQAAEYAKLLALRLKEKKKLKAEERKRRRTSSLRLSKSSAASEPTPQPKPAPAQPKQAKAAPQPAKGKAAVPAKGAKGAKEAPSTQSKAGGKTQATPATGKGGKAAPAQTGKGAKAAPAATGKGAKAPAGGKTQEKSAPAKGAKAPAAPAKGAKPAAPAKGAKQEGSAKPKAAPAQQKAAPKSSGQQPAKSGQKPAAKKPAPSSGGAPAKKAKK